MRRSWVAFVAAALTFGVGQAASAADMALKAPLAAPPFSWTGPYIGISGGYGWGHSNQTDGGIPCVDCVVATADGSFALQGGLVGGTFGYDWQRGPWVFGLEGDYSWADIHGSSDDCGAGSGNPHACGTKLESLGTFRGRIGHVMGANGNWLPYVAGGLAFGEVHAWDALFPASGSDFRAGWTVGAGVETAFARNWIFRIEYLYVDLGSRQMFDVVPGTPEVVSVTANIIRGGIDYIFQ
jgi:outer membrane immunogenic protein